MLFTIEIEFEAGADTQRTSIYTQTATTLVEALHLGNTTFIEQCEEKGIEFADGDIYCDMVDDEFAACYYETDEDTEDTLFLTITCDEDVSEEEWRTGYNTFLNEYIEENRQHTIH